MSTQSPLKFHTLEVDLALAQCIVALVAVLNRSGQPGPGLSRTTKLTGYWHPPKFIEETGLMVIDGGQPCIKSMTGHVEKESPNGVMKRHSRSLLLFGLPHRIIDIILLELLDRRLVLLKVDRLSDKVRNVLCVVVGFLAP